MFIILNFFFHTVHAGGFSAGALIANHEVVLGIDNCPEALKCFAANTESEARCLTLPCDVDWPVGDDLHVHFSPPCTALSRARAGQASVEEVDGGLGHLKWALRTIVKEQFSSFSIETVSVPATRALMSEFKEKNPDTFSFDTFECADFGVPQTRKRIICGPPQLIKRLQSAPTTQRVSVREVFSSEELPAKFLKNTTSCPLGAGARCVRSYEQPSFTVCGARSLSWCDSNGATVRCMRPRELAALQTFPRWWRLPTRSRAAILAVGNAVPAEMAASVIRAAAAEAAIVVQPTLGATALAACPSHVRNQKNEPGALTCTPGKKRSRVDDLKVLEHLVSSLERRVRDLESSGMENSEVFVSESSST